MVGAWLLDVVAGLLTGILSGCGVGGGTLLLLYMTAVAGVEQATAQGINLLYFLPTAAVALPAHWKGGLIHVSTAWRAILAGLLCAGLGAYIATELDIQLLRRLFGGFLLVVGLRELLHAPAVSGSDSPPK